ncbi:spore germination protein GerC [Paenibacillus agaridevorans]|uniref:Spore germination protein GerC n=1 Tax=Paenibacillus agaridevorans TaxID=171404 RepID=A0A2R5EZJ3_9BACL|nr:Ger(x)C family spore germination protein [Paenibacillus agaridevorans]GBG11535.1 spore germination protein GerC [Paenibacillus agaridevorans]
MSGMAKTRLIATVLVLLLFMPLLAGCWDRLEIDDRAVVLGVSIDEVSNQEGEEEEQEVSHVKGSLPPPSKGMVRIGVQIALPGRIPLGPGEAGGGNGETKDTVWVISVVGHTVDDAFMNLQQQISARIFFGHLRVIVLSESVAKKGIENINDFFRRNPEVRRMAWMMVAKGRAEKLIEASPKLERVPTLYLMSTLENSIRMGKFPKNYIGQFWSNSSKLGQEGFLPYIDIKENENVGVQGLAYFRGNHLVGTTKPAEISGFLGIRGVNPAGYRAVVQLEKDNSNKTVMTNVTHRYSRINLDIKDGLPRFRILVELEANLEEKINGELSIDDPETIRRIEQVQSETSAVFYQNVIRQTQLKGSDIFGFGEQVRAKKPGYWNKNIGSKEKWQEMYKRLEFDIDVNVKIRRVGMNAM